MRNRNKKKNHRKQLRRETLSKCSVVFFLNVLKCSNYRSALCARADKENNTNQEKTRIKKVNRRIIKLWNCNKSSTWEFSGLDFLYSRLVSMCLRNCSSLRNMKYIRETCIVSASRRFVWVPFFIRWAAAVVGCLLCYFLSHQKMLIQLRTDTPKTINAVMLYEIVWIFFWFFRWMRRIHAWRFWDS